MIWPLQLSVSSATSLPTSCLCSSHINALHSFNMPSRFPLKAFACSSPLLGCSSQNFPNGSLQQCISLSAQITPSIRLSLATFLQFQSITIVYTYICTVLLICPMYYICTVYLFICLIYYIYLYKHKLYIHEYIKVYVIYYTCIYCPETPFL